MLSDKVQDKLTKTTLQLRRRNCKTLPKNLKTNEEGECLNWDFLDGWGSESALYTDHLKFRPIPSAMEGE
jgi:hypothetical protein